MRMCVFPVWGITFPGFKKKSKKEHTLQGVWLLFQAAVRPLLHIESVFSDSENLFVLFIRKIQKPFDKTDNT